MTEGGQQVCEITMKEKKHKINSHTYLGRKESPYGSYDNILPKNHFDIE